MRPAGGQYEKGQAAPVDDPVKSLSSTSPGSEEEEEYYCDCHDCQTYVLREEISAVFGQLLVDA